MMPRSPAKDHLLSVARMAARAGAAVIVKSMRGGSRIPYESKARHDYVTAVDREAEEAIVQVVRDEFPGHAILAEEADRAVPGTGCRWIIDPLDGTTNFIHGFPVFSVAIAAADIPDGEHGEGGRPGAGSEPSRPALDPADIAVAVVHDPMRGETFTAVRGEGARLNGEPILVSRATALDQCLLATGFPFRSQEHLPAYLKIFADLHRATQGIRRPGSAALDLSYLAAGRVDGFFEFALAPWDMAAGTLLIREAGGVVKSFTGADDFLQTGHILAGPAPIAEKILEVVRRHTP